MHRAAALLCSLGLLVGCSDAASRPPPVVVTAADVKPTLFWSADLEDKRVAVDGYINLDNGPGGQAIAMGPQLTSQPGGRGEPLINFEAEQGKAANQLDFPVLKTESIAGFPGAPQVMTIDMANARFQDAAGAAYPISRKVRVTGRLDYARWSRKYIRSDTDPRSPTGKRFWPRLVDVSFEPAP